MQVGFKNECIEELFNEFLFISGQARKKKGISQQDLGKAAKVYFSNIGKYERGEATPASSSAGKSHLQKKVG